jgi:hypothetical protein
MKAQADKTATVKSKAVANSASAAVHETAQAEALFEDKRPEVAGQLQLAVKAGSSPRAGRIAQLQAMANASSVEPVQRERLGAEDELLEGESEPAQRKKSNKKRYQRVAPLFRKSRRSPPITPACRTR